MLVKTNKSVVKYINYYLNMFYSGIIQFTIALKTWYWLLSKAKPQLIISKTSYSACGIMFDTKHEVESDKGILSDDKNIWRFIL